MTLLHITDYTLSSSLGLGRDAHRDALQAETTGLRKADFDNCTIDCFVGEVPNLQQSLPGRLSGFDCRNHRLAWLALQQDGFMDAVAHLRERHSPDRIGVFVGTTTSGIHATELAFRQRAAPSGALPDWFDYRHTHSLYSAASFVANSLHLEGVTMTVSTACSSSAKVFGSAWRSLQMGTCDAAIIGGVDSLCLTTLYGFNSLQLIGADICRPADAARKGISIGEAAGFAIVTRPAANQQGFASGALLGYGESSDAYHMSAPQPEGLGAAAAMQSALRCAGIPADEIDYVNLHGTGTPANDAAEDRAVCAVLGGQTPCSSTKGWTGHTLGAAGIVEACLALVCIESGLLPRSLNTQQLDPALQANVLMTSRPAVVRRVMSNSFGFGGNNSSLILGSLSC